MSDDQNRKSDRPKDNEGQGGGDPMFARRPGGRAGNQGGSDDRPEDHAASSGDEGGADGQALDEDMVAKHRAARRARMRRRQAEQAGGEQAGGEQSRGGGRNQPPGGGGGGGKRRGSALPALRPEPGADTPALRAERVEAIRRDLVARRRRKGLRLILRLWLFVVLPTAISAWFLWFQASDLYLSKASFVVQSAGASGAPSISGGGILGMLSGGASSVYDPIAVQTYIQSRDMLEQLDAEFGWIEEFQSPELDFVHRLDEETSFEDAYDLYQDMVTVSFDPTEGILEMSVIAPTSAEAYAFSSAIIHHAEDMVDELSNRIRADATEAANRNLADANARLRAAQQREAEVRKQLDTFSVQGEFESELSIIAGMEVKLEEMKGNLASLKRITRDTDPRVTRLEAQIETLRDQINARRARVTGSSQQGARSLADINAELSRAQLDVKAGMTIFTAALEAQQLALAQAARQHRYLSVIAEPSMPDESNYPNKLQLTALAFLCFLGLYIVLSLTISLIREQASI